MSTTAHFQDLFGLISCKAIVIGVKFDLLPTCKQRLEYILQDKIFEEIGGRNHLNFVNNEILMFLMIKESQNAC